MAPEVLREEIYSEKADVFSFGVIIWELVTLEKPFGGMSPLRIVYLVAHQAYTLPIPDDCPPALATLIKKCWAECDERPSFDEVLADLETIADQGI